MWWRDFKDVWWRFHYSNPDFATSQVYQEANMLSVRHLYLFSILIRQHAISPPSWAPSISSNPRLCPSSDLSSTKTSFALNLSTLEIVVSKYFIFLNVKQRGKSRWLIKLTYDEYEELLIELTPWSKDYHVGLPCIGSSFHSSAGEIFVCPTWFLSWDWV